MSFTYDLEEDIGKIRLLIQDNVSGSETFSDEEIQAILDMSGGSIVKTAIQLCYVWASKCLQTSADMIKVDDITIQNNKSKSEYYYNMAKSLQQAFESGYLGALALPIYVGGVYQSDIDTNKADQDNGTIVKKPFSTDIFDTFNNNGTTGDVDF